MKKFKKLTALFLAAVMVLAMGLPAAAAQLPDGTPESQAQAEVTEPTQPDAQKPTDDVLKHKYTAYQIFQGSISENSLIAIQWGANIDGEAFLTELKKGNFKGTNPFADIVYDKDYPNRSADAVARVISDTAWAGDQPFGANALAREFARIADANRTGAGVEENGTLDAGYYLVVDEEVLPNGTVNSVRNLSFLEMVSDGTFRPVAKVDVPELTKEVKEINDSDITVTDQWGDVADYDIGDEVEFRLTGTLPADYDSYETYKYVFHDTLSAALTLVENSIVVKVGDTTLDADKYAVATDTDNPKHFTVTIEDLKTVGTATTKDSKITVEYKATLGTEGIVYGGTGNENTAYLEYSNDPNQTGDGTPTGTTPEDKVVVFTYQLIANKVGEDGTTALEGATFQLSKYNDTSKAYEPVGNPISGVTTFEFKGVDAGKYKLEEIKAPDGYNKAEDMYFEIEVTFASDGQSVEELKISKVCDADGKEIVGSDGTAPTFTFTGTAADGSLTSDIVNLKGIVLPSTGGIGTTIFYVLGGILVVGAGMLLVIKKRVNKAQ